uniref:Uncharacterized protein n=1 Tax=Octopus bimaculoides TaxID=37653 RepID=A0A0L8GM55_OCTBM
MGTNQWNSLQKLSPIPALPVRPTYLWLPPSKIVEIKGSM